MEGVGEEGGEKRGGRRREMKGVGGGEKGDGR